MKLSEIIPSVGQLIRGIEILSEIPLITSADKDHNHRLQRALSEEGLAIVATLTSGRLKTAMPPIVHLESTVTISVVENLSQNHSKLSAIEIVGILLNHLHRTREGKAYPWLRVDTNAYETGPIEGGLMVFFVNLTATSING